jgi:hypothetical protein
MTRTFLLLPTRRRAFCSPATRILLVYRQRLTNSGVVLIRLEGLSADSKGNIVSQAMKDHLSEMQGAFTVISPGMLRIRQGPTP